MRTPGPGSYSWNQRDHVFSKPMRTTPPGTVVASSPYPSTLCVATGIAAKVDAAINGTAARPSERNDKRWRSGVCAGDSAKSEREAACARKSVITLHCCQRSRVDRVSEQVAAVSFEIGAPRRGGSRIAATKDSSHNG